ncbi:transposon Ty3-G Gag-Pol polyprotein [Trichonephila clavata]|uniref:Transposon Ty3-G Gag-Pol polyprotein n=1 Tax=Trichonephila clavata TaxID=2740835 RepID=A0A8X6HEA0_TRICU|nr:transposon Ty3-G Gag-Pol polyprotein [Trichonephila clavata]
MCFDLISHPDSVRKFAASSVQTILTAVSDLTSNKAADIEDRILEVSPSPIEIFAVSNKNEQSLESKLFHEIEKLNKEFIAFQFLVVALHTVGTKIPVKEVFRISVIFRFVLVSQAIRKKNVEYKNALNHAHGGETALILCPKNHVTFSFSVVSLIPANYEKRNASQEITLAANSSTINVYGQKTLTLNVKLRRDFVWTFLIADVTTPILGVDFLHYFELVPDLRNKCLRDTIIKLQSVGHLKHAISIQFKFLSISTVYHKLLKEFPSITKLPNNSNQSVKHNSVHHIITKGHPVVAKPQGLAPDCLEISKTEFQNIIYLGYLRPSKSNYASPLHMVPKKGTLDWRPVSDYRALNSQTLKDKYPIPCIPYFRAELHGSKVFSRIDLVKAYHQIPIHPDDIYKTAICTPFGLFEST